MCTAAGSNKPRRCFFFKHLTSQFPHWAIPHCGQQTLGVSRGTPIFPFVSVRFRTHPFLLCHAPATRTPPSPTKKQKRLWVHAHTRLLTRLRVEQLFLQKKRIFCSKWFDKIKSGDILCLVLRPMTSSWEQGRLIKKLKKLKILLDKTNFYDILSFYIRNSAETTLKRKLIKN